MVKKTFPKYRKRQSNRLWKLKHLEDGENKEMKDTNAENKQKQNNDQNESEEEEENKKKKGHQSLKKKQK